MNGLKTLIVYDLSGKEIIKDQLRFVHGMADYQTEGKLSKGTYILKISESGKSLRMVIE